MSIHILILVSNALSFSSNILPSKPKGLWYSMQKLVFDEFFDRFGDDFRFGFVHVYAFLAKCFEQVVFDEEADLTLTHGVSICRKLYI